MNGLWRACGLDKSDTKSWNEEARMNGVSGMGRNSVQEKKENSWQELRSA